MQLRELLNDQFKVPEGQGGLEISGVCLDSRLVKPGDLFAALPGVQTDGRKFIPMAIEKGAVAVLAESGTEASIPVLGVDQPAEALAHIAANFYPRQPETIIAVTGTNGKSSTVEFLRQIWAFNGLEAAALGTLGITRSNQKGQEGRTTPDAVTLHQNLQALADDGVTHLAMEASSHGLKQHRMDGARLRASAFLNLTQDHLDYHPDFEDYYRSKRRLFDCLTPPDAPIVVVVDSPWSDRLVNDFGERGNPLIKIGRTGTDLKLAAITPKATSQHIDLTWRGEAFSIDLPLIGEFQALNVLTAAALAICTGLEPKSVFACLEKLQGVKGRLEPIATTQSGGSILIDYAHSPDGLEKLLETARPHADGNVHVLFGTGGDRDPDKRAKMGAIAARLADRIIVTDDNPRTEDPAAIRAEIMSACPEATEIPGREIAIGEAIKSLQKGDILLVAGKGHETGQILGDKTIPFDETSIIRRVVEELNS
jgi:UDP-N-acetylmuramoyl-L-alanyl-D-glutamate--2,6-diaminopimelate ligase